MGSQHEHYQDSVETADIRKIQTKQFWGIEVTITVELK